MIENRFMRRLREKENRKMKKSTVNGIGKCVAVAGIVGAMTVMHSERAEAARIDITGDIQEDAAGSEFESLIADNNNMASPVKADGIEVMEEADSSSDVVGILPAGAKANILLSGDEWTMIQSNDVKGYVMTSDIASGIELDYIERDRCDLFKRTATCLVDGLNIRDEKDETLPNVSGRLEEGDTVTVLEEGSEWIKIETDSGDEGYVKSEYVDVDIAEAEVQKVALPEEIKYPEISGETQEDVMIDWRGYLGGDAEGDNKDLYESGGYGTSNRYSLEEVQAMMIEAGQLVDGVEVSQQRMNIVNYALQFVGNPYVWGGTSLTNGADCSGFVQSVFRDNGISLFRTSWVQATMGKEVAMEDIRPGDLLFYNHGPGTQIGHVTMYIGNGKVVHASCRRDGIKVSDITYRTPCSIRNVIGD